MDSVEIACVFDVSVLGSVMTKALVASFMAVKL